MALKGNCMKLATIISAFIFLILGIFICIGNVYAFFIGKCNYWLVLIAVIVAICIFTFSCKVIHDNILLWRRGEPMPLTSIYIDPNVQIPIN